MNSKRTKAVAGPFLGELGYEACYWVPYVRYLANSSGAYNNLDLEAVFVREDRVDLYETVDANLSVVNNIEGVGQQWVHNNTDYFWDNSSKVSGDYNEDYSDYKKITTNKFLWEQPRIWESYGRVRHDLRSYDCLVHIRNKGDDRDLPDEFWKTFFKTMSELDVINSIGEVGTGNDKYYEIDKTYDLRGRPLYELFNLMSDTKCVVGAISGPLHLASLCGAFHIPIGDPSTPIYEVGSSKEAFTDYWNPFNTPLEYISYKHDMSAKDLSELVVSKVEECCKCLE